MLLLCLFFVACGSEQGGGETDIPKVPIDAPEWDGVKRAEVFYEIFVRSFADSDGDGIGDLNGVAEKLDYLDDMGVSGIWLMPINPSPSYHGYDITDYTAVNPDYGTIEDFDNLLDEAHERGIKVILDFVLNHTSSEHPWFVSARASADSPYRDYYIFDENNNYTAVFDRSMPDLNYYTIETSEQAPAWEAVCSAAEFWLERGVDGFRLDAVKHIYDNETSDENPRFLAKFHERMKRISPDVYLIGEVLSESNLVAPYYAGLPVLFDFSCWWRLEWALNNNSGKWFPKDLLDYEAMFASVRPDYIHATKLSNHDEDRAATVLGGNKDKIKMAAKVLLTVSGNPYLYYGEEIGTLGSKSGGDENVRKPLDWDELEKQQNDPKSVWSVYRDFLALRNADPVIALGKMTLPDDYNVDDQSDKQIMAFNREHEGTTYLVLHNLSASPTTYNISRAVKRGIFRHGGATISKYGPTRYSVNLPAYGTLICEL